MRILLVGATGAMGRVVAATVNELGEDTVVCGISHEEADLGFPVYKDFSGINEEFDCIIDFSNNSLTPSLLDFIEATGVPAVIATTGLSDEIKVRIRAVGEKSPILYSQNMSLGINTLSNVVKVLARALAGFDIEIIEKHHNKKLDAPSGTAELIFNSIKEELPEVYEVNDRSKTRQRRDKNEIGISAIRGGTIVGEHTVIYAGVDEVVEIKHSAGSKKIFANGALRAAKFLMTRENGFYEMGDVING